MPSDHELFNCSQDHEHEYVIRQYNILERPKVRQFLKEKCDDGTIKNFTHAQVFNLIKEKLGLTRE